MTALTRLYDYCATDSSFAYGRATKQTVTGTPNSPMIIPCDTCANANRCARLSLECKAFRQWSSTGTYVSNSVSKSMRTV